MATWTATRAEIAAMLAPPEHAAAILATHPDGPIGPAPGRPRRAARHDAGAIRAVTAVLREIAHRDARDGIPAAPDRTARTMERLYDLHTTPADRAAMRTAYRDAYHAGAALPF